jgi:hypothetical protein
MIKKIVYLFLLLLCLTLFLSYIHYTILDLENLQIKKISENLTKNQIINISKYKKDNTLFIVFPTFISLVIKIIVVSSLMFFGLFLFNLKSNFKNILLLVIKAEYIFLLPIVYEIIYFKFINTKATIDDIQFFYPLSALNIVGYKGLEAWYIYPFQVLNLFEVAYIFILAYYIGKLTQTNTDRGLTIVSASYVPALVLWVVCVMFFTLSYS